MSTTKLERPEPFIEGLVPTLNNRGFMSETLDYYSSKFTEYAGGIDDEVLDIGCAYGIATRRVLDNGGSVLAVDMDEGHIRILEQETPMELRSRLRTAVGVLPDVDFPDDSFGAILCSRVLHFLLAAEIHVTLDKMYRWLKPGGRIFLIADTPYTGFWFKRAPEYERRKADGEEWPGLIEDISELLEGGKAPAGMLAYLNPLDPDILSRESERAGFVVEESDFTGRVGSEKERHHAGVIAVKPT